MENDDLVFQELLLIEQQIKMNEALAVLKQKDEDESEFYPIYDEYYNNDIVGKIEQEFDEKASPCWEGYTQLGMKKNKKGRLVPNCVPIEKKSDLKDPDGGLTAAGRKYFKNKEGANLKPGVKGPADTPEKMRRKGSFLTRFFTNPSGPMVDEKGRATRLALSASAWGERVPKNAEDAAALAAKGKRLLERYKNSKEKSEELDEIEVKAGGSALGQSIGQRAGGVAPPGSNPDEEIDADGDGNIYDGTENEQAKPKKQREPYEKLSNSFLEKRRRREVQRELARQGITPTQMGRIVPEEDGKGQIQNQVYDRPEKERDARATARAGFSQDADKKRFVRNQLKKQGITANAKKENRDEKERAARRAARAEYDRRARAGEPKKPTTSSAPAPPGKKTPATSNPKPADRYPNPSSDRSRKPADRYPDPPNADRGRKPADRYPDPPNADRGRKPADRYPDPPNADRGRKPADRYPDPPNADRGRKPADRYPNPPATDNKPADRYPNPSSDRSRTPADRYPNPTKKYPPGQKPSPKKPQAVNMPKIVRNKYGEA